MTTPDAGDPDPYGAGPDPYGAGAGPYGGAPPAGPWDQPPVGGQAPAWGDPTPPPRRRRGLALVVGGAMVVLGLVAAAAVVALTRSDGPADVGTGPLSEPEEEWAVDLGGEVDIDEAVIDGGGGGVILRSDGEVVLLAWNGPFDPETDEPGEMEVRVFAADDGDLLWEDTLDGESYGGPLTLLGDGRLLVTEGYDEGATTRLLDARTGDEIWEAEGMADTGGWTGPFDVQAGPLPSDRLLLTVFHDDGDSREAVMVELSDGEQLWSERDVDAQDCGGGVITVADPDPNADLEDFDPGDVEVVGRDGRTGDEIWALEGFPGPCSDDVVGVATQDDEVVLVRVGSGRRSEPIELDRGADYTAASAFGDHVLINQFHDDEEVGRSAIYPMRGGEPVWEEEASYAFPLGDDLVLVPDVEDEDALIVRASDGEELDDVEIPGFDSSCAGALVPRTSLVCDDSSEVTSYALTGDVGERWSIDLDEDILALGVGGDRMFAVTEDQLASYR
jgi:outer membrane protein assembly factor BamB